jgi:hypothetical protein
MYRFIQPPAATKTGHLIATPGPNYLLTTGVFQHRERYHHPIKLYVGVHRCYRKRINCE